MMPHSVYIHIPFCRHRCGYCDFNTFAGQENLIPAYVDAVCGEIKAVKANIIQIIPVHTIFFGGGTPSLLSPIQIGKIIHVVSDCYELASDAEISIEANPGTVDPDSLRGFRYEGVNRISFGVQSADARELRLLERIHDPEEARKAIAWARLAGFENISADVIFGLPGQNLERWKNTLKFVLDMNLEHYSAYNLTIEEGTPLKAMVDSGLIVPLDDDLAADMYESAIEMLEIHGYQHYEISNWSKVNPQNSFECRHNLQYWRNKPYFGFGAGAHGYLFGKRTANILGIKEYITKINQNVSTGPGGAAAESVIEIDKNEEMKETLMVGLRLLEEGVSKMAFAERFGVEMELIFGRQLLELEQLGLIENGERIRLTKRGCLVGNQVFMRFVGD